MVNKLDINQIREFNRFYTRFLGVFNKNVFDLDYSMLEMRILGEIGRKKGITSVELTHLLNIDKSYLSRILAKLQKQGYLTRQKDKEDSRLQHIFLTESGLKLNRYVEEQSNRLVNRLVQNLDDSEIQKLKDSMKTIERILSN